MRHRVHTYYICTVSTAHIYYDLISDIIYERGRSFDCSGEWSYCPGARKRGVGCYFQKKTRSMQISSKHFFLLNSCLLFVWLVHFPRRIGWGLERRSWYSMATRHCKSSKVVKSCAPAAAKWALPIWLHLDEKGKPKKYGYMKSIIKVYELRRS